MLVLGIETSCDETAAAIVRDGREIISSVIASQIKTHERFGGVVPELASREHLDKIVPIVEESFTRAGVTQDEIDGIGGENIAGAYACMKYFQSLDNPNNKAFVPAFKKMWGEKTVIGDVTQAAYLGPWLWKLTAEKAGSFDIDKIAAASPGVEFKGAPEGYVRIHENHHLWSKTRVGKAKADGQYELIYETADLVEPDPFPKGYQ